MIDVVPEGEANGSLQLQAGRRGKVFCKSKAHPAYYFNKYLSQ